ncbi:MAG: MOSC domain-containing protein [Xanthobacteraceae bacterium]
MASIQSIYRYPVKGLSPEPLARTVLKPGETIPGDRLYAIENGPSGFDPAAPAYLPKQHFLMLMRNERLAALRTAFDQSSHILTIDLPSPLVGEGQGGGSRGDAHAATTSQNLPTPTPKPSPQEPAPGRAQARPGWGGEHRITGDLRSGDGRAAIEKYFAAFCADELRGPPKILHAEGHSFSDVARKVVSIINLASVGAIEAMVGAPVNPLRFRGNVYVEGWPAWSELDLVGKHLAIGATKTRLKIVKRIVRCAATNVDPDTGIRDLNVPQALMRANGYADCGIYAEVVSAGEIATGDAVEIP